MKAWAWCIPGLFLPLWWQGWPTGTWAFALPLAVACLVIRRFPVIFYVLIGMAWTGFHVQEQLQTRQLDLPADPVVLYGEVISLPVIRGDMLEFRVQVEHATDLRALEGNQLLVRWYRNDARVSAGEVWTFKLRLKPARGRVNFRGPDRERWYFSQGIGALGIVMDSAGHRIDTPGAWNVPALREATKHRIEQVLEGHPTRPQVLALALADRSELSALSWQRFRITGTSHLLAISGMHIGLAAILGFWLGRAASWFFPSQMVLEFGKRLAWGSSLLMAGLYSLLAGFSTSTQRALLMLTVFVLVQCLSRRSMPWQGFLLALLAVLIINPLSPLEAGFWLSFGAVGILLATFGPRTGRIHWLRSLVLAQLAMTVVMMPLGMFLFGKVTLLGLVANLVAIPWISLVVVPSILLALLLLALETSTSAFLLIFAAESLNYLDSFLANLERWGAGTWLSVTRPTVFATIMASLGVMLVLIPMKPSIRLTCLLLAVPAVLPPKRTPGWLELEMLDVGQGLSVLVKTGSWQLLYDTGPGDGHSWSLAGSAIIPALNGQAPDLLIVSHGDLDHSGGLFDLTGRFPNMPVMASFRKQAEAITHCNEHQSWSWAELDIQVLHPSTGLPYLGNDSSCVLSLRFGDLSILLTGDIGSSIEQRLLSRGLTDHDVLFAPHHGSKSSSSEKFVKALKPDWALVSTSYNNSFNFPDPAVSSRYRAHRIPLYDTAVCGAIRLSINLQGDVQISSARLKRAGVWRWPAEAECP